MSGSPPALVTSVSTLPSAVTRWIDGVTGRGERQGPAVRPFWVTYTPSSPTMHALGAPPTSA